MERVLYNGFLVGVSLKGDRFFYQNPLMSYGNYERFDWINTPCCPPNVVRLIASLGRYVYAMDGSGLYVNLFVGSRAKAAVGETVVTLRQQTRYPWDGQVSITVDPEQPKRFALYVRIPGWARNEVMPGGLYQFTDRRTDPIVLRINGRAATFPVSGGFAKIERLWSRGDRVEVVLPMPVRRVVAHPKVADDAGRVALERGPLVYAAEWPDNGGHALHVVVPDEARLESEFRADLLDGVSVDHRAGRSGRPRRRRGRPAAGAPPGRDSLLRLGEPGHGRDAGVAAAARGRSARDARCASSWRGGGPVVRWHRKEVDRLQRSE